MKRHPTWILAGLGLAGIVAAAAGRPDDARAAASQDWPPFVLVAGLLLIGLVADAGGLFAATGQALGRLATNAWWGFAGATVAIGTVTAVLNLDTSVAFLTPVLVHSARARNRDEAPLLYGSLLLANAGSCFLPGSNLTNLILVGHLHLSGSRFLSRSWAPALAALGVTAVVIATMERRALHSSTPPLLLLTDGDAAVQAPPGTATDRDADRDTAESDTDPDTRSRPVRPLERGLGAAAVVVAAALVVSLPSPSLPVAAVGLAVAAVSLLRGHLSAAKVAETLGLPVLVGLFGVAVALGTLGRAWSGPARLLGPLGAWGDAALAAAAAVVLNNLPATSLFAGRPPMRPFPLLLGLNLGPNLFATGSLAWFLWWRVARGAGARPSLARASRLGIMSVPPALAAALALLQWS